MNKVKYEVSKAVTTTKRVLTNGEQFIQATALAIVTGFTIYASHKIHIGEVYSWIVAGACVIVAIRAFVEYVKFLDRD